MGKYETKNSSSVVRFFGAASAEMFQPEVNASSYQIRRRYFRLQKFIRLCVEMRYLVIFISMGRTTELYYSLEERLIMKKCRQKHGGFWALLTPLGTYGYWYLPLTNRDAMLLTKSFAPLVFAKKFMAFLFSGQSLREKSFLFRLWT